MGEMKIMNEKKRFLICFNLLLLIMVSMISLNNRVLADDVSDGMGFSVSPILPATQIDPDLGYYYLKTEPNEEQKFEVMLSSQKEETQEIQMFVQDAYTGSNGVLTYGVDGVDKFKQDKSLTHATSQIVTPVSESVELAPGESKVVSFKVKPPTKSYDGAKIGRLVFKPAGKEEDKNKAIVDEYQYGVSIILSESGDDYSNGDLKKLNLGEVKPTIKRGKRLVTANLQNSESKRLMNIELLATVTEKGSDKVIKQTKIPDFQFAPNSNVDLEIDWGLSEISAGEYTVNILAKNSYDDIHLTKDFRIEGDEARELNQKSAFKIKTPTWVKITAISTGVISFIVFLCISVRNNKWKKLMKRKRKNRKKIGNSKRM